MCIRDRFYEVGFVILVPLVFTVASSSNLPFEVIISVEDEPLGTGGAISKTFEFGRDKY